jgi:hypothetical protein
MAELFERFQGLKICRYDSVMGSDDAYQFCKRRWAKNCMRVFRSQSLIEFYRGGDCFATSFHEVSQSSGAVLMEIIPLDGPGIVSMPGMKALSSVRFFQAVWLTSFSTSLKCRGFH